jgi:Ca2+-transporting ATPase
MEVHCRTADEVLREFTVDSGLGLSQTEVEARRGQVGLNELPQAEGHTLIEALLAQVANVLFALLLAAIAIAIAIGEWVNAAMIGAIVAMSVLLGFTLERRAGRALGQLRDLAAPSAKVLRDGSVRALAAKELVPGDIVLLDVGNYVPADARLLETYSLEVNEASLTGESVTVRKEAKAVLGRETVVADRVNCAFGGTMVTRGRGIGVVTATGANMEVGRIAELLAAPDEAPTPLQRGFRPQSLKSPRASADTSGDRGKRSRSSLASWLSVRTSPLARAMRKPSQSVSGVDSTERASRL